MKAMPTKMAMEMEMEEDANIGHTPVFPRS